MSLRPSSSPARPRHRRLRLVTVLAALAGALLVPGLVFAHPLGNFTINHYAGVRIEPDRIVLDVVIDQAEIPTFQARLDFDTDGDGEVSDDETEAGRVDACAALAPSLDLRAGGTAVPLTLAEAGLTFPQGVGGLPTMRLVCGYTAQPVPALATGTQVTFADTSDAKRLGWREIVVSGSGVRLAGDGAEMRTTGSSARLSAYPTNLLAEGLHDASMAAIVTLDGPLLAPPDIADAFPVPGGDPLGVAGSSGGGESTGSDEVPAATEPPSAPVANVTAAGSVPGGVGAGDLPAIFRTADLSPAVLLVSLITAAVLGAGHALTPGHGKTLMAAYLVGTRGTPVHAAGLGLSVTVSHTLGILVLAGLIVGAEGLLSPDTVVRAAPVVAAVSIVAIGGWMLLGEVRRRRRAAATERAHVDAHTRGVEHDHDDDRVDDAAHGVPSSLHRHGGVAHTHLPAAGTTITWRGLFALGLAGGLIPSTSALLILLGSIAAGRPAFGFVLVVAFGLGMALVMGGIGVALVLARGRLEQFDAASPMGRLGGLVPLAAACLVLGLGLYLTVQALGGSTS